MTDELRYDELFIIIKGPIGWKRPAPFLSVIPGMKEDRFRSLFQLQAPKVQLIDKTGSVIALTPELLSEIRQIRTNPKFPLISAYQPTRLPRNRPDSVVQTDSHPIRPLNTPPPPNLPSPFSMGDSPLPSLTAFFPSEGPPALPSPGPSPHTPPRLLPQPTESVPPSSPHSLHLAICSKDREEISKHLAKILESLPDYQIQHAAAKPETASLLEIPSQLVSSVDYTVFCLTPNALSSYWTLVEAIYALRLEREQRKRRLLIIAFGLGPVRDKEKWRAYFIAAISEQMKFWDQQIAARLKRMDADPTNEVAISLGEHREAIHYVLQGLTDLANRLVDVPHPVFALDQGSPTPSELQKWLLWLKT